MNTIKTGMRNLATYARHKNEYTKIPVDSSLNGVIEATHYILASLGRRSLDDTDRGCPIIKLIEAGNT